MDDFRDLWPSTWQRTLNDRVLTLVIESFYKSVWWPTHTYRVLSFWRLRVFELAMVSRPTNHEVILNVRLYDTNRIASASDLRFFRTPTFIPEVGEQIRLTYNWYSVSSIIHTVYNHKCATNRTNPTWCRCSGSSWILFGVIAGEKRENFRLTEDV